MLLEILPAFVEQILVDLDQVYRGAVRKAIADLDGFAVVTTTI